jgi:O-antigen/teichoic acid export membrane protein
MTGEHAVARRTAVGTASNALGAMIVLLCGIVAAPIIVHAVGAADYGRWVLVASIASLGILVELGMSAALVKFVAEHSARDEIDEAARTIAAATWLYWVLGACLASIGLIAAVAVPAILGLEGDSVTVVRALAAVASIDLGLSMLSLAPQSVLKGLHRFPVVNTIQAGGAVLGLGMAIVALAADLGIVGVSAAFALSTGITAALFAAAAKRLLPGHMAVPIRRDPERVRRLVRFSRSIAAVQVAFNMQNRLDVVVIAAALPVRMVTPYSFAQRLAIGTRTATDQFGKVLLPLASEISATRDADAVRALFLTSTRLSLAVALAVGLPIALLGGPILGIWVGDEYSQYGALVAILTCAVIIDIPGSPAAAVLQSVERHGPMAWMSSANAALNIGLSIALVGPYGIEGVAVGTLVAGSAEVCFLVLPYACRVLRISVRVLATEVLLPLVLPTVAMAAIVLAGDAILPVTSLARLLVVVGAGLSVYGLLYVFVAARPRERAAYRAAAAAGRRFVAPRRGRMSSE